MTIAVSANTAKRVEQRAEAVGLSVDEYLEQLVRGDEEWGELASAPLPETNAEFHEIKPARNSAATTSFGLRTGIFGGMDAGVDENYGIVAATRSVTCAESSGIGSPVLIALSR